MKEICFVPLTEEHIFCWSSFSENRKWQNGKMDKGKSTCFHFHSKAILEHIIMVNYARKRAQTGELQIEETDLSGRTAFKSQ